jgi:preprotein translocase subunit SecE
MVYLTRVIIAAGYVYVCAVSTLKRLCALVVIVIARFIVALLIADTIFKKFMAAVRAAFGMASWIIAAFLDVAVKPADIICKLLWRAETASRLALVRIVLTFFVVAFPLADLVIEHIGSAMAVLRRVAVSSVPKAELVIIEAVVTVSIANECWVITSGEVFSLPYPHTDLRDSESLSIALPEEVNHYEFVPEIYLEWMRV